MEGTRIYCKECKKEIGEIYSNGTIVGSFENIHVDMDGHIHIKHECKDYGWIENILNMIENLEEKIKPELEKVKQSKTFIKKDSMIELLKIVLTNLDDIVDEIDFD